MPLTVVHKLQPNVTMDDIGLIPFWLNGDDPAPAHEQLDRNYQHGGGWRPMSGFTLHPDNTLTYEGDPPYKPIAEFVMFPARPERVIMYKYGWVAIIQPDRSFEVSRMD